MNFQFPKLYLTELPQLQATNLLRLVAGERSTNQSQNLDIPLEYLNSARPRSIDEIITDIENQSIDNITSLEWIYCLSVKETWDEQQPKYRALSTSKMIWNIAQKQNYDWLKYRLFYRLVSFYNGNISSSTIAQSFVETFFPFQPTNSNDATVIKIIQALQSSQPDRSLAELSFRHLQTPQTLFIQNRLPYQLLAVKRALNHVIFSFLEASSHDSDRVSWLLDCFDEMDREPQLQAVENLLNSQISDRPIEIANWLKNNYGLGVINSRWHELSQEAKIKLRQWIGAINYQNFDDFVNLLIERLDLNEKQENQLIKRKEFWSNYSNKFERINILLPLESATTLNMNTDSIEFIILENDGNDLAEICIFDFGDKIIIEFFRGRVSETRLLDKTSQLESDLFDNKRKLSITYLRSLGGKVHDHVFCWQYYCERWLAQHNIFPNEGIKQFKVSPNKYNQYSIEQGLPKPSFHDMQERQEQEQRWLEKINRLEQQARDFISRLNEEVYISLREKCDRVP